MSIKPPRARIGWVHVEKDLVRPLGQRNRFCMLDKGRPDTAPPGVGRDGYRDNIQMAARAFEKTIRELYEVKPYEAGDTALDFSYGDRAFRTA
ncbi:MAG: hypothetical protein P4L76_04960 [Beijerinckiaceae bacterium]|nr:hypothetical protein [Beijerinckiaceae bacterium]